MVEGPGATRNGRKVQPLVGLVLREIIQPYCISKNIPPTKTLEGRRLESAFSVGKEVFLILGPVLRSIRHENENENTIKRKEQEQEQRMQQSSENNKSISLRLHFGMNGCLTVRKIGESSKLAPWRKNDKSSNKCIIKFSRSADNEHEPNRHSIHDTTTTTMVIETVASTCTVVSAFVAQSKLKRLSNKDVCGGSNFEPQAVLESILEKRSNAMVCDALLDQDRFPGVGNIIKIEGLHKAGVHPRRLVEKLSRDELMRTILECRTYAMGWHSSGRAPTKKVYNQTKCGSCRIGRVRMVKMGKDLTRVTFWCESCQPISSSTNIISNSECREGQITSKEIVTKNNQEQKMPLVRCPQHGSKTILLRRVRKTDSSNIHRLFRTCKVRGCQYFSWADAHLPSCGSCRGKTVLRVSKTERTGGRWFLSCAASSSRSPSSFSLSSSSYNYQKTPNTCSFFQWATSNQLAPFADELSPLT